MVGTEGRRLSVLARQVVAPAVTEGPASPVKIVIPILPEKLMARLRASAQDQGKAVEFLVAETKKECVAFFQNDAGIVGLIDAVEIGAMRKDGKPVTWRCDKEVLEAASSSLKWVQNGAAGQDAAPLSVYREKGVVLTNAAVITGNHLADHIKQGFYNILDQLDFEQME